MSEQVSNSFVMIRCEVCGLYRETPYAIFHEPRCKCDSLMAESELAVLRTRLEEAEETAASYLLRAQQAEYRIQISGEGDRLKTRAALCIELAEALRLCHDAMYDDMRNIEETQTAFDSGTSALARYEAAKVEK